ncbi:MAG: hypothetical protein IPK75_00190 [Acidobacteria bacterium]|nr:hypothetical protein [Acidobacteriota bacterium]
MNVRSAKVAPVPRVRIWFSGLVVADGEPESLRSGYGRVTHRFKSGKLFSIGASRGRPVAGQRNVEAIRSLIEHALFAFFDRDTAISSTDGRYAGQICSAKVSFVTNSDEVRILMRNPADPDRVDVSFVLQHQSALGPNWFG